MKKMYGIITVLMTTVFFCVSAFAQNPWVGSYEFDEDGGKTGAGTPIYIVHQLDILETDDGLIAIIQSNGFQTLRDLIATTKIVGNRLNIYFENYGENNSLQPYKSGELLFSLERKSTKDTTEFLTFWDKFQPGVPKNEKSGKVYFKKARGND